MKILDTYSLKQLLQGAFLSGSATFTTSSLIQEYNRKGYTFENLTNRDIEIIVLRDGEKEQDEGPQGEKSGIQFDSIFFKQKRFLLKRKQQQKY